MYVPNIAWDLFILIIFCCLFEIQIQLGILYFYLINLAILILMAYFLKFKAFQSWGLSFHIFVCCLYVCAFEAERWCFLRTAFCHNYFYGTLHPLFHQSLGNLLILTKLSKDLFVIWKVYIDLQQEIFLTYDSWGFCVAGFT